MQTFLPYSDFNDSAECLDYRRLGKQRIEARQILKALTIGGGWVNHPAVKMWRGYEQALIVYGNCMINEWINRKYHNTMQIIPVEREKLVLPPWIGNKDFHISHRSNLIRKDPTHYRKFFPDVPDDLPYVWPVEIHQIEV